MVPQSITYSRTPVSLGNGGRPPELLDGGAGWAAALAQTAITAKNAASRFRAMACPPVWVRKCGPVSVVVVAHDTVILQQLDIEDADILLTAPVDEIAGRIALCVLDVQLGALVRKILQHGDRQIGILVGDRVMHDALTLRTDRRQVG